MMIGFNGVNYSKLFSSTVSQYQNSPISNLIYGSAASRIYSQTVAKNMKSSMSSYLTSLNSAASSIKNTSKPFSSGASSAAFSQKSVSSDSSAASGTASVNADLGTYTLKVSQLAASQENSGNKLDSDSKSQFNVGVNTVNVKVGNTSKNISFTIDENDSNKSGLQKMAAALNYAKAGVTANVVSDSKTGTSSLKLTTDNTGTESTFSLSDITGNAVSVSGGGNISAQARNAEYTLDGKEYSSQSNTVSTNNGKVKITLLKADNKDTKLTVSSDVKGVAGDLEKLVDSYNSMMKLANSYTSTFDGAGKLKEELNSIIKGQKSSLSNIGITQSSDGTLAIDKDKLESSIDKNNGYVKDVIGGNNGFAQKLYSKANEVLNSPVKYSKPQAVADSLGLKSNSPFDNTSSFTFNYRARTNLYLGLVVDTIL